MKMKRIVENRKIELLKFPEIYILETGTLDIGKRVKLNNKLLDRIIKENHLFLGINRKYQLLIKEVKE